MLIARVLIADDFAEWRVRIRLILQERTKWQVIDEACDGSEAVMKAADLRPEVVLLDVAMPILNGIEAAAQIQRVSPSSEIIFVTQDGEPEIRRVVLAAGARGFLIKSDVASELLPAISAGLVGSEAHPPLLSFEGEKGISIPEGGNRERSTR